MAVEAIRIIDEDTGTEFIPEREPVLPMPSEPVEKAKKPRPSRGRKKTPEAQTPSEDTAARRAAVQEARRPSGNSRGARAEVPKVTPGKLLYRVGLVCPTALAHPSLEIEAVTEAEAKDEFCRRNGISDSVHAWTIVRLA